MRHLATRSTVLLCAAAVLCALALGSPVRASADESMVASFGSEGLGAGQLSEPGGIAVNSATGRVFVADTANNRIDEFTTAGRFIRAWGWGVLDSKAIFETCLGPTVEEEENGETEGKECFRGLTGPEPGELNEPIGVAVSPDGKTVYAINAGQKDGRIESFALTSAKVSFAGNLPAGFGRSGNGEADLTYPLPLTNDVVIGSNGRIYVADNTAEFSARIYVFSPARKLLKTILPAFSRVTAMTVGPDGLLYLADSNQVEVIDPEGTIPTREFSTEVNDGITAIAFAPGSENLLLEPKAVESSVAGWLLFEVTPAGEEVRTIEVESVLHPPGVRPGPWGLAVEPTYQFEDESGRSFKPGLIYFVDRYGGGVDLVADQAPGRPSIESTDFEAGVEGVNLTASVSPVGADTSAYFEYGPTAAYGLTSPAPPGSDIGSSFEAKSISTHLYGLQAGATYHYRVVATNALGTVASDDATFATFPIAGASSLPDGRAWEQVSTGKGTNSVIGNFAAPGGDGVAFSSIAPLPGSASGGLTTSYVGLRLTDGWKTSAASPPVEDTLDTAFLVSSDLTRSVGKSERDLTGNAPPGVNLYLRDNATGAETLMTPYSLTEQGKNFEVVGDSADFDHIFFQAGTELTPDSHAGFETSLYEYSGGVLRNVGILPGASAPTTSAVRARSSTYPANVVSADGTRVFFTTEPAPQNEGETNARQLFVRIDGNRTVEVSASQAKIPDPEAASQEAKFVGASADGSVAFFKSSARLTDDADTGSEAGEPRDREPNLYRYDFTTGALTDLTVSDDPADEELGAAATGGVLVSDDGASAYFVARGDLAPGATSGASNLYRWTASGGVTFLATLQGGDLMSVEGENEESTNAIARTTADGSVLMLTSSTALDPAFPGSEGTNEIFRYTAAGGSFTCISCTDTSPAQGVARIARPSPLNPGFSGNVLSPDGSRFFFQTTAALVPQDTNGVDDVYEWENGVTSLISSGVAPEGANLVDASVSGDDVFFTTAERLVPGDQDGYVDVYDAKVGGGLPGPAAVPPPCEGGGCRTSATSPPETSIASRSYNGPANPKHHRRKHKKKHHRAKHRKHSKQRRNKKRPHGHAAAGKRG